MMGDPSTGVSVDSGTDTDNLNRSHHTGYPVGSHALPDWISWVNEKGKPVLTPAQVESLNPSLQWFKVVTSEKVPLPGAAVNIGAILYGVSSASAAEFHVGTRLLVAMSGRGKRQVLAGIDALHDAGFLHVSRDPGRRSTYTLCLPVEPPTGFTCAPRRTGEPAYAPRRTEDVSQEVFPRVHHTEPTYAPPVFPRVHHVEHLEERSKNIPTDDELIEFEFNSRNPAIPEEDRREMARAAVDTDRDAVVRRYQRQDLSPADLFLTLVRDGLSGDLADTFDNAKHGAIVKAFHDSGLEPSQAARIVLDAKLDVATNLPAFIAGVIRKNADRRNAA